jgi:outer membrane protein assembly factor BamD (BamD/ComL family)
MRKRAFAARWALATLLAAVVAGPAVVAAQEPTDADLERAKVLYDEAEGLAKEERWQEASAKYEEAYYLVPGKHGFAFKVGDAAWQAGDCARAEKYLQHFRTYAPRDKHADYMARTDVILNEIEFKGCAVPAADPAETEASEKKGCAVAGTPIAALAWLLLPAWTRRRLSGRAAAGRAR